MDNLNSTEQSKHSKYNEEPVAYCAECLSLKILSVDGIDYCDKCGSTFIKEANIFDWERMYAAKYAGNYLDMK